MPRTATADRVDRGALIEFLRPRHRAVLLTRRSGGDAEGQVVVATYPQRAKVANARREPAVSLCRKDPRAPHRSQARGGPLHEAGTI